nr:hypothetical protein GCM10020092_067090 [Actinoplanes digitatis]
MNLSRSRTSMMRTTSAAVLAATTFAAVLPGIANAAPSAAFNWDERSVSVKVNNQTDLRLSRDEHSVDRGFWTKEPPKSIGKGMKAAFGTVSAEYSDGTEGTVTYATEWGPVNFYWRNPDSGDTKYTCDTPRGGRV